MSLDDKNLYPIAEVVEGIDGRLGNGEVTLDDTAMAFYGFLADRLRGKDQLYAMGVAIASSLVAYDLENGVDGFTGEPIDNAAVGLSTPEYNSLIFKLPDVLREAGQAQLADELNEVFLETFGTAPEPEVSLSDESEIVSITLTSLDEAEREIIGYVREKVEDFDWDRFFIDKDKALEWFPAIAHLILRQAPVQMPVTILRDEDPNERGLIANTFDYNKRPIGEDGAYWLVQLAEEIPADYATYTRDHLLLKSMEAIGGMLGADPQTIAEYQVNHPSGIYRRATLRLLEFMQANGIELDLKDTSGSSDKSE